MPFYISIAHIACAVPGCTEVSAPEKEGEGLRKRVRCAWSVKIWQSIGANFKCLTVLDNYEKQMKHNVVPQNRRGSILTSAIALKVKSCSGKSFVEVMVMVQLNY